MRCAPCDSSAAAPQALGIFVHPRLSTVTYLSDEGAPTVVFPRAFVSAEGAYTATPLPSAMLVPPRVGRHCCFDGRLLHGAPARLCASASPYERITFLVNIWIGHVCYPQTRRRFSSAPGLNIRAAHPNETCVAQKLNRVSRGSQNWAWGETWGELGLGRGGRGGGSSTHDSHGENWARGEWAGEAAPPMSAMTGMGLRHLKRVGGEKGECQRKSGRTTVRGRECERSEMPAKDRQPPLLAV